ncbi:MAG TPA: PfkB family carbohydrate kinase, partial [Candidatus Caenarcaniphilales bacterium]|nr:PfkB family carbohydrate kinase [Candidatus Caenarcaniphilales bacterium]
MQLSQPRRSLTRPDTRRRGVRAPRLVAVGDVALDIVVHRGHDLAAGTDVPGRISFRAGGSAANTCRVFAGLGGGSWFVGAVGRDPLGGKLVEALRAEKVRVHAARVSAPTARLVVMLAGDGERSFVTARGAADGLRPTNLRGSWFAQADVLHLPAYSLLSDPLAEAAMAAADTARRQGALISVDLASRRPLLERGR